MGDQVYEGRERKVQSDFEINNLGRGDGAMEKRGIDK